MSSQASVASNASGFSETEPAAEGEVIVRVIADRRRTGGKREYLCRITGDMRPRWRADNDVSEELLTVYESAEAVRIDREEYERSKDSRKRRRDEEKCTLVHTFRDSDIGKLLLSQTIRSRGGQAAPNRMPDVRLTMELLKEDGMELHEIRTSDDKRAVKDAVLAAESFGDRGGEFDYIGKHAIDCSEMVLNGSITPAPAFTRFIRDSRPNPTDADTTAAAVAAAGTDRAAAEKAIAAGQRKESTHYVGEVERVVPLGAAVTTHDASDPAGILDVLERHSIKSRNSRAGFLQQGVGGKGSAITKRPKSLILLIVYGARYKPEVYRAKIDRINKSKSGGPAMGRNRRGGAGDVGSSRGDAGSSRDPVG